MPTPRAAAALLAALALAAAGCPSSDSCESSAICQDGRFCFEGACVSALPAGSCTPPTTNPTLATGSRAGVAEATCDRFNSATWPRPVLPALPAGWSLPLRVGGADVAAPVIADVGQIVSFTVPPGAASVTIHQQGIAAAASFDFFPYSGLANSVVPTALTAPNGATIYDDDLNAPLISQPFLSTGYYGGLTPWAGSYTFPGTSRVIDLSLSGGEVPAGEWSFEVNDWNAECARTSGCSARTPSGSYEVTVVARPGPYVSTGTLNIGIYLPSGSTTTPAAAVASTRYQRFVRSIGQFLGRAGICLGTVTFFDVPAWAPANPNIGVSPPCNDLSKLFSLASPSVEGVHIFLVDSFAGGDPGTIGIDGSIPGPSGLPGAVTSGAAMIDADVESGGTSCPTNRLDLVGCGSDYAAYVAAHEIGHWLGLYHTTERTGDRFDPIEETAICPCRSCAPSSERGYCGYRWGDAATLMAAEFCLSPGSGCGGADNLMFWIVNEHLSVGNLSPEQSLVMRVNPAVKP